MLVTGGERGLGLELVKLFLQRTGAHVVVWGQDLEAMDALPRSHRLSWTKVDVSDRQGVSAEWNRLGRRVDVVVNNAGVVSRDNEAGCPCIWEILEENIRQTMEVNVLGPIWMIQAAMKEWDSKRIRWIVNISSVTAHLPAAGLADYVASKAALSNLTASLRLEMWKRGLQNTIRVVLVSPFLIKTGMFAGVSLGLPWIFPPLEVKDCAHAIFEGIACGDKEISVPWSMGFIPLLVRLMPSALQNFLFYISGALDGMEGFSSVTKSSFSINQKQD